MCRSAGYWRRVKADLHGLPPPPSALHPFPRPLAHGPPSPFVPYQLGDQTRIPPGQLLKRRRRRIRHQLRPGRAAVGVRGRVERRGGGQQKAGLAVFDEVAGAFCVEADDGEARSEGFEDDLAECLRVESAVGPGGHALWRDTERSDSEENRSGMEQDEG